MILVSYFDKVGVKQKTWDDFIDMIFVNSTNIFLLKNAIIHYLIMKNYFYT